MMTSKDKIGLQTRQEIGYGIYQAIEKSGMTREQIAAILEVSIRSINNWQSGKKLPGLKNTVRLVELLNISIDSLIRK